jgi:hypothetical protein
MDTVFRESFPYFSQHIKPSDEDGHINGVLVG